jgi:glycosyltransferase involved in cell wall biosynthesis
MSRITLSIIIPVYNEVPTLRQLLYLVSQSPLNIEKEIIIVDAGSDDGSTEIIQEFSFQPGFKTVFLTEKTGKGLAVREGLRRAEGSLILIQDGDLEYDPQDYPSLLAPLLNSEADIVIGSRRMGAKQWNFRSSKRFKPYLLFLDIGDFVLTKLFCFFYSVKITDPLTMYKVFWRHHLGPVEFRCKGFDFDWELLCELINADLRFKEIPVSYNARTLAEGKKLRAVQEGFKALKVIFRLRLTDLFQSYSQS